MEVIAGAELSAEHEGTEVHILALHLSRIEVIAARLERLRTGRIARARAIVGKLNSLGIQISFDEVMAQAGGGAVGRPHVARALVARGVVPDLRDAFSQYLRLGSPAYVAKEKLAVADAVSMAHEAGGLAVWAHPGHAGVRAQLEPMVSAGLDGVEVLHPSHSAEDCARLQALADFFHLVPSGGSDWHGTTDGPRRLGCMEIPHSWLGVHRARIAARNLVGVAE